MFGIGREIGGPKDEPIWHDRDNFTWYDKELPLASYPEQDEEQVNGTCRCGTPIYVDSSGMCGYCYLKWGRRLEEDNEKALPLFRAG